MLSLALIELSSFYMGVFMGGTQKLRLVWIVHFFLHLLVSIPFLPW